MSHFLDRLTYFRRDQETFSGGHGITTRESRKWEDAYRKRWAADKIVRSTHGVNCTGSCSWKIYVKGGIVTWETQQTDYPRTRPDLPNHEPRGCPRGASYSWYLYSGTRIKYPLVRARLIRHWREARSSMSPVAAWRSIVQDSAKRRDWVAKRGRGGFVRVGWDEINELIAAANAYTIREYGPDRIAGFSPIPAMSMISYAAGTRYLSLLGGTMLSFYDWYCDLPPSSPQVWGEQTDVPESADWYNAGFLLVWGSNVPMTRAPDAHFYSEVRYRGAKSVVIAPDYNEAAKFSDMWLHPKQGTDAALALALGHVVLREFYLDRQAEYFADYTRRFSDFPLLVTLAERDGQLVPDRMLRAADLPDSLGETNNPDWKAVGIDEVTGELVAPLGSSGFRWGEQGKWNLEERDGKGRDIRLRLSLADAHDGIMPVSFPYFGGTAAHDWVATTHERILKRNVPVREIERADGGKLRVATVFDLYCANYGLDRGFGGENVATSFDDGIPFTPAWAEKVTGVPRQAIIQVAREFAANAETTKGRSMVILGAGLNHWYHMDMSYRGIIQLLVMCGCVGKSGGGWAHYVGQEKLRPQTGWLPLAFALDWTRPPRQMNGTSFFYAHSDQWRYETMKVSELLSPLAPAGDWSGAMIDVYLIVPPDKIGAYRSVLRVMLGQHLAEAIKWRADIEKNNRLDEDLPESFPDWPMMFYLDELPQLGYMRIVEEAVAITRSYRVRLWLFTQDMAQLKEVYPKWESLLANCRCQIFFRPNEMSTATEIANRLGMRKDIWGGEDWVASPQKLMGPAFREDAVIFLDGLMIRSRMVPPVYANPALQAWIAEQKQEFGEDIIRAARATPPPSAPDDEPDASPSGGAGSAAPTKSESSQREDADLADNQEYQRRLAALQAEMRVRKAETSTLGPERSTKPPERPVESSEPPKRPPMPPKFDE